jgi:hypothetical protein
MAMLPTGNPAPALASNMRSKKRFDIGGLLVLSGWCYKFNTFS